MSSEIEDKTEDQIILECLKKLIGYEECSKASKEQVLEWYYDYIKYAAAWSNYYYHETANNMNVVNDGTPSYLEKSDTAIDLLISIKEQIPPPESANGRFDYGKKKNELIDQQKTTELLLDLVNQHHEIVIENHKVINEKRKRLLLEKKPSPSESIMEPEPKLEEQTVQSQEKDQEDNQVKDQAKDQEPQGEQLMSDHSKLAETAPTHPHSNLHHLTGFIHDLNE